MTDPVHSTTYRVVLANAAAVFAFSDHHAQAVLDLSARFQLGVRPERVYTVPIYVAAENDVYSYRRTLRDDSFIAAHLAGAGSDGVVPADADAAHIDVDRSNTYDVLFFGGSSARRMIFLKRMQERCDTAPGAPSCSSARAAAGKRPCLAAAGTSPCFGRASW